MSSIRPVRLPDRFYLPRRTYSGQELFDVLPWEGATGYVTDGERYGIAMADGSIRWLEESRTQQFADDFAGIDLHALIEGLREYCRRYRVLQSLWSEDLQLLENLRTSQEDCERKSDFGESAGEERESRGTGQESSTSSGSVSG